MKLAFRILVNAIGLWLAARLVDGISLREDFMTVLIVALVFGVINTFIRPVVKLLTLPLSLLTLGLFILVVNALMLLLLGWLDIGLTIEGSGFDVFFTALLGALIISIVSAVLGAIFDRD